MGLIAHVDMDAFFASVEQRDAPALRGRPVIVGGDGARGVVAAASYEARRYGVRSAMPAARARRLCPHAVFVRSRHAHYLEVSRRIFEVFAQHAERVEGLSVDEAYLDLGPHEGVDSPLDIGRRLKQQVFEATGLTASVGLAGTKLVAKLASDYDKPDGLTWVPDGDVQRFLDPLPVRRIPGIGPATERRLHDAGLYTVGQLRQSSLGLLQQALGRSASTFKERAHGIDPRAVDDRRVRRSISQESTFSDDLHDLEAIESVIRDQARSCASGLRDRALYARTVHLKLRSGGFSTLTRSRTLDGYTRDAETIAETACALARAWAVYQSRVGVRLIGTGVSGLSSQPDPGQML
jgi:DNA polymerase-4